MLSITSSRLSLLTLLLVTLLNGCTGRSKDEYKIKVTGKVMDQNGAAIPGALIIVETKDSTLSATATTNERGEFSLRTETGSYKLTASAEGFSASIQTLNFRR